jgi:hypothetical protein
MGCPGQGAGLWALRTGGHTVRSVGCPVLTLGRAACAGVAVVALAWAGARANVWMDMGAFAINDINSINC